MLDLTSYLPKPFEMTAGTWTITSPVPTFETGKLITAFQALQAEQARRVDAGEPPLASETIEGFPDTVEDLARLMLSDEEYERLIAEGCPYIYITNAATAALIYWANGGSEEAVHAYNQAITSQQTGAEKAPKSRSRKRSKNGQPTA